MTHGSTQAVMGEAMKGALRRKEIARIACGACAVGWMGLGGLASAFMPYAGLALVIAVPRPVQAQALVYDPTNYAQNLLSATRALEQIRNQLVQIEQAAAMLRVNPLQLSPELSHAIDEAQALFATARAIAFEVDRVGADLRALYPETWDAFALEEVLQRSDEWLLESRASLQRAMEAEAHSVEALARTQGRIAQALGSSTAAEGQTGAVQAGNQLLGVQAGQLAEIQALLAAQGRALQVERMERVARETRAREIQRRAFPDGPAPRPAPARPAFER
jgi:P-type conjugative transfer protein TrbJ